MVQFEKMAGEAVFLMEPGVQFSLVYQYSAPGSLRIIAGLRGLLTKERLSALALIIVTTPVNNGFSHFQGKAMHEAIRAVAGEQAATLTYEDIEQIAEAVRSIERSDTVTAPRREFYRAVEPDEAITGVGAASNEEEEPPAVIVPRSELGERSGAVIEKTPKGDPEPRILSERVEVVLANAPLIESRANWRIFHSGHQISVKMLDE